MKAHRLLILVAAFVVAIQGWKPSLADGPIQQATDRRYFPETGHWVGGDFLTTYYFVPNPTEIYGYPITESFFDQLSQRWVQYFQKARFELSPDFPSEIRVFVTHLGSFLYEPTPELYTPVSNRHCLPFLESGKRVCYDFLDFFKANGGAAQFGYPISNFEIHDGLIVQYFQRSRLEWHPNNPPGKQVIVSNLGEQYFDEIKEDPSLLIPMRVPNGMPYTVLSLRVRAFPKYAVMPSSGSQTIYITVQDQRPIELPDTEISLEIKWPSGRVQDIPLADSTNKFGVTSYELDYEQEPEGLVEIVVRAIYEDIEVQTITSFRIWY